MPASKPHATGTRALVPPARTMVNNARDPLHPPFPRHSPFVASAALELEGEHCLQDQQEVEQGQQPVTVLFFHPGHSPDSDQRVQHEQQPGDQGLEQNQPLHPAGAFCHPGVCALPTPRTAPCVHPCSGAGQQLDSTGAATAGRVPPHTPAQGSGRTGDCCSPRPLQRTSRELFKDRGQSQLPLAAGLCRHLRLHHPGSPGCYSAALPIFLRMLSIPVLFPTPRTSGSPQECCPALHSEQKGFSWWSRCYRADRGKGHSTHSLRFPTQLFSGSFPHSAQLALLVTREYGTQENQRICCPSSFRKEVFAQFEELKLPGTRGNQKGWSFPDLIQCMSILGSGTPEGGGRRFAANSRLIWPTVWNHDSQKN